MQRDREKKREREKDSTRISCLFTGQADTENLKNGQPGL